MNAGDLLRVIALTPVLALAGGALGVFLIGLTQEPRTVAVAVPLLIFPQMFLSGALIPVSASSGLLGALARVIPMTYSIEHRPEHLLLGKAGVRRGGPPSADARPGHHGRLLPRVHIVGTVLFVRADRNR